MLGFILGLNLKLPKTCFKWLHRHIGNVLCKKPLEKTPNIREMTGFRKMARVAIFKCYSKAKWSILGLNLKVPKTCLNDSLETLQMFYAKTAWKNA